jgi:hypothetical protein
MDFTLLAIAALLTLSGFYLLEAALTRASVQVTSQTALAPARNQREQAWRAEPLQVFLRQLLMVRQRRMAGGFWRFE